MKSFDEELWDHLVEHHGADRAQVRARTAPRIARRPIVVGIAATGLAAAGAATVLATSSGGSAHPTTAVSGGPDSGVDTAYIVKRVKAEVADEVSGDNTATRLEIYRRGELGSDGTLVDLGPQSYEDYGYTAPDGAEYDHAIWFHTNGSSVMWSPSNSSTTIAFVVTDPVVNGRQFSSETGIDPANHTYTQYQRDYSVPGEGRAPADPPPSLNSSPPQVQQSLQNGQVTLLGTPMFNGAQTIALSFNATHYQSILYVDPQTYKPVGEALLPDPSNPFAEKLGLEVYYWVPATPANIAKAKDDPIPAGYTKVGQQAAGNSGSGTTTNSTTG